MSDAAKQQQFSSLFDWSKISLAMPGSCFSNHFKLAWWNMYHPKDKDLFKNYQFLFFFFFASHWICSQYIFKNPKKQSFWLCVCFFHFLQLSYGEKQIEKYDLINFNEEVFLFLMTPLSSSYINNCWRNRYFVLYRKFRFL